MQPTAPSNALTTTGSAARAAERTDPSYGYLCLAGAVLGVALTAAAVVVIAKGPSVTKDHFSYPFATAAFRWTAILVIVNQLLLLVGVVGLLRSQAGERRRLATIGASMAIVGLVALTACQVRALSLADALTGSSAVDALNTAFGIAATLLGLGLLLAGIATVRAGRWTGWCRWTVLATGIVTLVITNPAQAISPLAGQLGLLVAMLSFATVGLALVRDGHPSTH